MLNSLDVVNLLSPSNELSFGLSTFRTNPYQILDVQGLGPVPGEVAVSPYANADGEEITNVKIGKRNIVLRLGYNPNYSSSETVAKLRQELYKYFMPGASVSMTFGVSGFSGPVKISGVVETVEPAIFTQNPEVVVSILCSTPYFESTTETLIGGKTKASGTYQIISYPGSVACGFTLKIFHQSGDTNLNQDFQIRLYPYEASSYFDYYFDVDGISSTIVSSNHYTFVDTRPTKKDFYVKQISPSLTTRLLSKFDAVGSYWSKLYPGDNRLMVYSPTPEQSWELRYNALYGGL